MLGFYGISLVMFVMYVVGCCSSCVVQDVCSGGVVEVDSVVVVASFHSVLRMFVVGGFFCFCGDRCVS